MPEAHPFDVQTAFLPSAATSVSSYYHSGIETGGPLFKCCHLRDCRAVGPVSVHEGPGPLQRSLTRARPASSEAWDMKDLARFPSNGSGGQTLRLSEVT